MGRNQVAEDVGTDLSRNGCLVKPCLDVIADNHRINSAVFFHLVDDRLCQIRDNAADNSFLIGKRAEVCPECLYGIVAL